MYTGFHLGYEKLGWGGHMTHLGGYEREMCPLQRETQKLLYLIEQLHFILV